MKRTASISEILRPLKDAPFQAYLSNAVQVADILEWIREQTGTAEVWQDLLLHIRRISASPFLPQKETPHIALQSIARPQGHQQDRQTVELHSAGCRPHFPCRQPFKSPVGTLRARRHRSRRYLAEPHSRQPCRKCIYLDLAGDFRQSPRLGARHYREPLRTPQRPL